MVTEGQPEPNIAWTLQMIAAVLWNKDSLHLTKQIPHSQMPRPKSMVCLRCEVSWSALSRGSEIYPKNCWSCGRFGRKTSFEYLNSTRLISLVMV